ncbi:MAG: RNA polymerase sigma factor, partial [Bryobacteraceae bacterium]
MSQAPMAAGGLDPDTALMLSVRAGEPEAFERLVERHRLPLVQFLYRMVQDREAAEELAQEIFLRVYRSRGRYQPSARFTTWLYRIATNLALNWLRHERRRSGLLSMDAERAPGLPSQWPAAAPTPEELLVGRAQAERVRRAVAALPGRQRAVVLLHKYHEMDYEQI